MRMGLRLAFWLIAGITGVSRLFAVYQVEVDYQGRRHELMRRAAILAESLQETVERLRGDGSLVDLQHIVDRFANREHVLGISIYDENATPIAMTTNFTAKLDAHVPAVEQAVFRARESGDFLKTKGAPLYV